MTLTWSLVRALIQVCVDPSGKHVVVNGETFAMVILATGVVTAPSYSPLHRSVEELLRAPTVDGLAAVDSTMRWMARAHTLPARLTHCPHASHTARTPYTRLTNCLHASHTARTHASHTLPARLTHCLNVPYALL